ncbi:hypothetical protein [Thauera mechernichensis]
MKAPVWISAVVCIIYGAIVFAVYEKWRDEALDESRNLQQVKATVKSHQRPRGKPLSYFTEAEYQIDGKLFEVRVAGDIGTPGTIISLWVIPGSEKGFVSRTAYVEQATALIPFMLFPLAVFLIPLLLAVVGRNEKLEH